VQSTGTEAEEAARHGGHQLGESDQHGDEEAPHEADVENDFDLLV
jgi:hypothetical protein